MSKTCLVLDCNYLCHRAWYSTGTLQFGDLRTGVVYGFFQSIITLQDLHNTSNFAFCWDRHPLLRERDYPDYKLARRKKREQENEEKKELRKHFDKQVRDLRKTYLPDLGYKNIFSQVGYEADDIIGSICTTAWDGLDFIIVSSDHDMYQLLSPTVSIWDPKEKRHHTEQSFSKQYGVTPLQWIDVKAIAGCKTDGIDGIEGVGEKTAAKFINGTIKTDGASFEKIVRGNKTWKANRHLVKLPYSGCNEFVLQKDHVNAVSWQQLVDKLGFKSLKEKKPTTKKKRGFGIF